MANATYTIGLPAERCRELFKLVRCTNVTAEKPLPTGVFGYFEAFAAAGMHENRTEGQVAITIPCSTVTRRGFLKAIEQGLGHRPTSEEVLSALLKGRTLHEDTVAAVRRDIENLTATKGVVRKRP